jgi:hypothetical protein
VGCDRAQSSKRRLALFYSSAMNIPHPSNPISQFWVKKAALAQSKMVAVEPAPLLAGQVRLKVDSFALTANNMTYAAFGDAMSYWHFYPTGDDQWGIVPVWGFATVVESGCDGIEFGERFYGYYPMASEVLLTPAKLKATGFIDAAAHRATLHAVYNQYHRTAVDPFHNAANTALSDALEALLRPLFLTSWLIDDFLGSESFFGASTAILSSASSKTAYGTAYCLKQRPGIEVIGLTSAANIAFCERLGCYDRVIAYEDLAAIAPDAPCVYIDFAGNAALRMAIHSRFSQLRYSCSVGGTHITELGSGKGLPGPRAVLFFAPAQSAKRVSEWGASEFGQRIVSAWNGFTQHVANAQPAWLEVQFHHGSIAAEAAYQAILSGKNDPAQGHLLSV